MSSFGLIKSWVVYFLVMIVIVTGCSDDGNDKPALGGGYESIDHQKIEALKKDLSNRGIEYKSTVKDNRLAIEWLKKDNALSKCYEF